MKKSFPAKVFISLHQLFGSKFYFEQQLHKSLFQIQLFET